MRKRLIPLPVVAALIIVAALAISSWVSPGTVVPLQQATPTTTTMNMPPLEDSWIIVDLPDDATQLEYGAEVYRLVCKACHGDKGQGLTDDWRAQWAPEDQNCWQSKCHASNHPPDGFYMPQAPAVLGQPIRGFGTALNLYTYIRNYMPWHNRGSLTEKDSWSVTAYLLKMNGIDPGAQLYEETAAQIDLSAIDPDLYPTSVLPTADGDPVPASEDIPDPGPGSDRQQGDAIRPVGIFALVLAVLIVLFITLARKQTANE